MTVQEYLKDVEYNQEGGFIAVERDGYGTQNIADIRGYGYLDKVLKLPNMSEFQDKVGEFIVQAIREKITNGVTHDNHNKRRNPIDRA